MRRFDAKMTPVPTTSPGAHGADPFQQARMAARELSRLTGRDHHDVLVVLGTGLAPVAELLGAVGPPIDLTSLPWFPHFTGLGHRADAWSVELAGRRLLVTAGRLHLYEGRNAAQVAHTVRTAMAAGCATLLLTCAAGGIRPDLEVGQVALVADHLNLTGTSPLTGLPADDEHGSPFVDLTDAWSPRLRALARAADPSLRECVYAQLPGPHLETPAEITMLGRLGADLVGMSLTLEAIAGRHLGAEVLGLAVVTNQAAGTSVDALSDGRMHEVAASATGEVARVIRSVVEGLGAGAAADAPALPVS